MKSNADKAVEICDAFSRAVGFGRTTIEYEHDTKAWTIRWHGKGFEFMRVKLSERQFDLITSPAEHGAVLGERLKVELAESVRKSHH